ncbi:MAG TPA: PilZ domain-containing protein [Myxococcota bacterium]|nr:PilZ domain-containing protein [Myxococcota bacterium]HRY97140.1 PilZ domain-containing protein [Myxococcota bacterium]HSA23602.1 PilZ domain-containing protein [Myxococcota bacterium]
MAEQKRIYERIPVELPCRLFIAEEGKRPGLRFEAFCRTQNLGLGGVFVESTFLIRPEVRLQLELGLPEAPLVLQGRVAHNVGLDSERFPSGMGIQFLGVGSQAREALLRYFTPERYQEFYAALNEEFPHLKKELAPPAVSLLLNLWEEWKIHKAGGPRATEDGAPEPLPRRTGGKR